MTTVFFSFLLTTCSGFEHFKKRRAEEIDKDVSSDSDLDLDEFGQPLPKKKKTAIDSNTSAKAEEEYVLFRLCFVEAKFQRQLVGFRK